MIKIAAPPPLSIKLLPEQVQYIELEPSLEPAYAIRGQFPAKTWLPDTSQGAAL